MPRAEQSGKPRVTEIPLPAQFSSLEKMLCCNCMGATIAYLAADNSTKWQQRLKFRMIGNADYSSRTLLSSSRKLMHPCIRKMLFFFFYNSKYSVYFVFSVFDPI